jgi:hypothetical protein
MKKKLFFKLFIFAVIGSLVTMTSCKDYDDDIDGLNTEVTGLKTELTTLNSDITSAKTAATQALSTAQEALEAAEKAGKASDVAALQTEVAAIQAQLTALSGLEAEVTALMAELQTANEAQLADIEARVQTLTDQLKAMLGGMVTNVSLELTDDMDPNILGYDGVLNFNTIKEVENVFEEGIDGAITFVKDRQIQTSDFFVIRVSPTNAEITPEMISLQNSKGEPYDNIEVVSVVPYDKLLTRSTADGSGLWKVTVQLKEYDADEFEDATKSGTKNVLFAVAVDNTKTAENPMVRKVISTYDLELTHSTSEPSMPTSINYFIGDKAVNFTGLYPAVQNQPFDVVLTNGSSDTEVVEPPYIRAFYVTLNEEGVSEHDLNLWKSYNITGLNKIIEKNAAGELKTSISIGANTAIDDEIEFRVYAVNIKGQLVDNDGIVFKVTVGKEGTNWNAVNTVATPTSATLTQSAEVAVSTLTKLNSPVRATWEPAKTGDPGFNAIFLDKDGHTLYQTSSLNSFTDADFSKVKKIYTMPTSPWTAFENGKSYTRTLTIFNASDHVLASLDVTFTKVLPTTAPAGFGVKEGQIVDGIYKAYLTPGIVSGETFTTKWTAPEATHGSIKLSDVFTFGSIDAAANYKFSFAASEVNTDPSKPDVAKEALGNGSLWVAKKFIDNTTPHATTIKYNYGKISSTKKAGTTEFEDYTVDVMNFTTVYNNIYNDTYSWKWAKKQPSVTYGSSVTTINYADSISGVSTRDGVFNAPLSMPYEQSLKLISAKLISNTTQTADYFNVAITGSGSDTDHYKITFTATQTSVESNPVDDVPSTLVFEAKDMYGNDLKISLPMTVKKR